MIVRPVSRSSGLSLFRMGALLRVGTLTLGLTLGACAKKEDTASTSVNCGPMDQRASYMAPLVQRPTKVLIDSDFSSEERNSIVAAIQDWNTSAQQKGLGTVFAASSASMPASVRSGDFRVCEKMEDEIGNDADVIPVIRVASMGQWEEMGQSAKIPAFTVRCTMEGRLTRQIIFIQSSIAEPAQFEVVALHELGHAAGLDHSCASRDGSASYRGCGELNSTHPYRQAVMYPWITQEAARTSSTNEILGSNDLERLSCRYQGTP